MAPSNWLGLAEIPRLETQRLVLRGITEADLPEFRALFADPRINEHIRLNWGEAAEARKFFDSFKGRFSQGRGIRWSITLRESGAWVGNFGFRPAETEKACLERGLQIASAHWRRGYGDEASRAAMDWVKRATSFQAVDAWIALGNRPAIALVERQGFQATGETQTAGELTLGRYRVALRR